MYSSLHILVAQVTVRGAANTSSIEKHVKIDVLNVFTII